MLRRPRGRARARAGSERAAGEPDAAAIRRLARRCLEKDPKKRRLADAADCALEIEDALPPRSHDAATTSRRDRDRSRAGGDCALPLAVPPHSHRGCADGRRCGLPWRAAAPPRVTRTAIANTGPAALTITGADRDLAISPDGTHVVYVGNSGTQLFVRALDALEPVAIASGAAARAIRLAGWPVGRLRRTPAAPRSRRSRSRAARRSRSPASTALPAARRGPPDDTIIFATSNPATGLQRVSAAGGTPEVLTRPDHAQGEADHLWPEILPGGRAVLFTITSQTGGLDAAQVAVRDLRTGTQKVLLRGGSHGHYVASGHLVYVAAGTLRAIPFDPNRLETHGTAVPVLPRLARHGHRRGRFRRGRRRNARVRGRAGRASRRTRARSCGSIGRAKRSPSPRRRAPTSIRASRPTGRASRSRARSGARPLDLGPATGDARRA